MRGGSFLGWGVVLVTLTTSAGCKENETGVAGQAPEGLTKLAMGAFFPVTVEDACRGGGKLNPCTTQVVTKVNRVSVSGGVTLGSLIAASTNTPAVCLGPGNAQSWQELASGSVRIIPVAAGTCRLSVGIQGAATRSDIEVEYELQP